MPFRLFAAKRRHAKSRKDKKRHAKRQKKNASGKTKKKNNAMLNYNKTKSLTRKHEIKARKDEKTPCQKTQFEIFNFSSLLVTSFRLFAWRLFVFSPGVISPLRLFARRLFVFSPRKDTMRKDEKTPCEKTKRQNKKKTTMKLGKALRIYIITVID